jgi:DNA-binding NtrC family response regulator
VEAAHGGTLFLDEIGDVPLAEQVKLLRLLETGIFRRVGGIDELRSDFRLLCATNRSLSQMVETGAFRRDLYFRISAFPIHLPPLRERKDDIPVLVDLFLKMATGQEPKRVSVEALSMLENFGFPGNVRELHNLVERACLLADGDELLPEHFPDLDPHTAPPPTAAFPASVVPLAQAELEYLRAVVAKFQGSRSELARVLGLSPRTLYRKLQGLRTGPDRGVPASATVWRGAGVAAHRSENRGDTARHAPGVN